MKLIIPEYINKENNNNLESKQEFISKFNESLKSKDPEVLCSIILSVKLISDQFKINLNFCRK